MRLLTSLQSEVEAAIRSYEAEYAAGVLGDFREGLTDQPSLPDQIRYCVDWQHFYADLRRGERNEPHNLHN